MKRNPKKNSLYVKILIVLNCLTLLFQLFGMGTLGSFIQISLLTLTVPLLCLINILFFIFWVIRFQWPAMLFLGVLAFSFQEWQLLYQFEDKGISTSNGLKIMSYNVRSFNRFRWLDEKDISTSIENFINESGVEVVCFQEYAVNQAPKFKNFPYQIFKPYLKNGKIGSCIISKYPLINSELISFKGSKNGGMQSDLVWNKDTLRLYNLHFESFRLERKDSLISSNYSEKIRKKLDYVSRIQSEQVDQFNALVSPNSYPEIVCTDLNNNAFSKAYKQLAQSRIDSYTEHGEGFGATYFFSYLPIRIDFIFTSKDLKVLNFKTHQVKLSDHKPISVKVNKG